MKVKDCTIFAGGEISDYSFIDTETVRKSDLIICADSGYVHAKNLGITPHIIVGDFDSYIGELPENVEILRSSPEKDDTDTMLAIKTAIEKGYDYMFLYGGTGGRLDHTIANIQAMIYAHEHGCDITMLDEKNTAFPVSKDIYIAGYEDYYLSVFALSEEVHIKKLTGVKYPLENYVLKNSFPIGVSNEFTSDCADLEISSGLALIIYSKK